METHSSLVFLTRDRAWKLKKPVRLGHVDQSTLAARERLCREELRLNRELSGRLYRGLRPLVQRADGSLALGGKGRIIDWIIEIVRLPAADMLDKGLANGPPPTTTEITAVGLVLVGFYQGRDPMPEAGDLFLDRLFHDSRVAAEHLREMAQKAGLRVPDVVLDLAGRAIRRCRTEIMDRARRGLLIDGHGDLRAEHVCLTDPPIIFDRLEIDASLRIVDPYFEVGALGIECALLGGDWIGAHLLGALDAACPPPSARLQATYGLVACLTRARFAVDHFRDPVVPTPQKWRDRAQDYLLAASDLVGRLPHD